MTIYKIMVKLFRIKVLLLNATNIRSVRYEKLLERFDVQYAREITGERVGGARFKR